MEREQTLPNNYLNPHSKYPIFDPNRSSKSNIPWKDTVPRNIMITPDEKGVIITHRGEVRYLNFGPSDAAVPKTVFEHSRMGHTPIVTMGLDNRSQLIIISAINYVHPETRKDVSEYKIYRGKASEPIQCNDPINGVWLTGPFLVISHHNPKHPYTIIKKLADILQNLEENDFEKKEIKFEMVRSSSKNHWTTNVTANSKGTTMILAENQGTIRYGIVGKQSEANPIDIIFPKEENTGFIIRQIKLSKSERRILYTTATGQTKKTDIYDLLENSPHNLSRRRFQNGPLDLPHLTPQQKDATIEIHDEASVEGGNVKSSFFSRSPDYTSVSVNQGSSLATAHWTKQGTPEERRTIKVYREGDDTAFEEFILMIPSACEETYDYITKKGQRKTGIGHIIRLAFCGNRITAVWTNGILYSFSLDKKYLSLKMRQDQHIITSDQLDRPRRRRSKTFSAGDEPSWVESYKKACNNLEQLAENPDHVAVVPKEKNIMPKQGNSSPFVQPRRMSSASQYKTQDSPKPLLKKHSPRNLVGTLIRTNSSGLKNSRENSRSPISPKAQNSEFKDRGSISPKAPSSPINSINKREESEIKEHGSISPQAPSSPISSINKREESEIKEIDSSDALHRGRSINRGKARVDIWDPEKK
jgi:hypothetical protein